MGQDVVGRNGVVLPGVDEVYHVIFSRATAALRVVDVAVRLSEVDELAARLPLARSPTIVGDASTLVEWCTQAASLITVGNIGND